MKSILPILFVLDIPIYPISYSDGFLSEYLMKTRDKSCTSLHYIMYNMMVYLRLDIDVETVFLDTLTECLLIIDTAVIQLYSPNYFNLCNC